MKYFLLAGEASGDLHGSQLIKSIKQCDAEAQFSFFGGDMMASEAGVEPLVHYRNMAYMGIVEVVKHLKEILGFLSRAKRVIDQWQPDAVVLIDYPSFNLKVAKYAFLHRIKTFYFISPKVWAWKEYRVKQIKKYITALYSILPFETEFFARHGYDVCYVGNPTVNEIGEARKHFADVATFCKRNGLSQKPILAIVPGSRRKEISDNLPTMVRAASAFPDYQMVIAGAPGIDEACYGKVLGDDGLACDIPVVWGQSFELVADARVALVTSGTATLETAVLGTPQVVCYRMGASKVVYFLYKHFLKVKYVSLPNLIVGKELIPELLLHHCDVPTVKHHLEHLLPDTEQRRAMLDGYEAMKQRLGENSCTDTAAKMMIAELRQK